MVTEAVDFLAKPNLPVGGLVDIDLLSRMHELHGNIDTT